MAWYYNIKLFWKQLKKTNNWNVVLNVGCIIVASLLSLIVSEGPTRPTYMGRQNQKWSFVNKLGTTRDELRFQSILLKTLDGVFTLRRSQLSKQIEYALEKERNVLINTNQNDKIYSIYKNFICAGFAPDYVSFCGKTLFHHSCFHYDSSSRIPKTMIINLAKALTLISPEIGMYMYFNLDIENFDCQLNVNCLQNLILNPIVSSSISSDTYLIVINFIEDCIEQVDDQSEMTFTDILKYLTKMLPKQFKFIFITRGEMKTFYHWYAKFDPLFILDLQDFTTRTSAITEVEYDTLFTTTEITIRYCASVAIFYLILGWILRIPFPYSGEELRFSLISILANWQWIIAILGSIFAHFFWPHEVALYMYQLFRYWVLDTDVMSIWNMLKRFNTGIHEMIRGLVSGITGDMIIGHCNDAENMLLFLVIVGCILHIRLDPFHREPFFVLLVFTFTKSAVVITIVTSMATMVYLCYLSFTTKKPKNENEYKEWFYRLKLVCDNSLIHCIVDRRLERKYYNFQYLYRKDSLVESYIDLKLHHRSMNGLKRDELSEFELFYLIKLDGCENQAQLKADLIGSSQRNQSILCRWLLLNAHSFDDDILEKALDIAFLNINRHIAKAVAWTITKAFFKLYKGKLTNVLNLYPAIKCKCKHKEENQHWMCSNDKVIVAIYDEKSQSSKLPTQYKGFKIYEQINKVKKSEGVEVSSRLNEIFSNSVVLRNNIPRNRVSNLFKTHSNLSLLCTSPIRSSSFGKKKDHTVKKETCVQIYCLAKGMLPMGEDHFPVEIANLYTDIFDGRPYFISNLHIGEKIGTQMSMGTLGGFVRYMDFFDCFLTCAHVMYETQALLSSSSNFARLTGSIAYTHTSQPPTEIGKVIWRAFDHDDRFKTSIDAALVHLQNNAVIDPNDYILDSAGNPCHFSNLGLNSIFINENFVDPEDICGRPQPSKVVAWGARTQIQDSGSFPKRSEIEVLFDEIGQTSGQVNRSNFFPLVISCPAHMQLSVGQLGQSHRRTFVMYNQMVIPNLNLQQGDSGTCLYIINHPENKNGCIGMAIAFCSGVTVVTPMKDILQRINS